MNWPKYCVEDKTLIIVWASQVKTKKIIVKNALYFKIPVQENQRAAISYPIELLSLLLQRLLLQLLNEIYLLKQPHLTAAQAFQLATDMAVNLGFNLQGNVFVIAVKQYQQAYAAQITK